MTEQNNWCNPWLAAILGFLVAPIGLMYAGNGFVALLVTFGLIGVAFVATFLSMGSWLAIAFNLLIAALAFYLAKRAPLVRPVFSRWYALLIAFVLFVVVVTSLRAFFYEPFKVPSESMFPTIKPLKVVLVKKWGYGHYDAYGVSLIKRDVSATLQRGDVIAYERMNDSQQVQRYMSRIIGLPGDVVRYENNQLKINGVDIPQNQVGLNDSDYSAYQQTRLYQASKRAPIIFEQVLDGRTFRALAVPNMGLDISKQHFSGDVRECQVFDAGIECKIPNRKIFLLGDNRTNSVDSRIFGLVDINKIIGKVN